MNDLPEDYSYKIIENNEKRFMFRIKNIADKESALAWLSAYERKSKFTWRIARTYPYAGKIYIFHADYRCHHNTDNRFRHANLSKRISKHTGCEATLKIKVKKYVKYSRSRYPDMDVKDYPCIVILDKKHNHSQFNPEVLRFRDMAETTKNKLLCYFKQGFSASRARRALEAELMLSEENFESAKSDTSLLPTVSTIQHLFVRTSAANGTRDENSTKLEKKKKSSEKGDDNATGLETKRKKSSVKGNNSVTRLETKRRKSAVKGDDDATELETKKKESAVKDDDDATKFETKRKKSGVKGTEKNSTSQLYQDWQDVLLEELNHDLILKVGDKELHAHQDVLRVQSPVFESILSHEIMKKNNVIIEMYDCDPQAMEQFLLYVYSGKVDTLDQTNMLNLYYIADKYDTACLKEKCSDFIKKSFSVTNICEVIQFALSHSDSRLLDSATEYFSNNALDILRSMEWQSFLKDNSEAANELLIKYFEKLKT